MAKIKKILGWDNKESFALVYVLTDNQDQATVYIGGDVELFHDDKHDVTKAYVKKYKDTIDNDVNI